MTRDFEKRPYSADEARVAAYIVKLTGIGAGDDPIGFLIASHQYLRYQSDRRIAEVAKKIVDATGSQQVHHIDGNTTNNDPNNLMLVEKDEHINMELEGGTQQ